MIELRPIGTEFELTRLVDLYSTNPVIRTTRYRIIRHGEHITHWGGKPKPCEVVDVVDIINERPATYDEWVEEFKRAKEEARPWYA